MTDVWQFFYPENIATLSVPVIFLAFFFATFVSEDAACLTAGALAGQGSISLTLAISACLAGIFVGDILLYWIGRIFGHQIFETRVFKRFVSKQAVDKASVWLETRGASAVFISRFITGLRLPTYLAAGFLKTDFGKFTFYFLLAATIWTPILVGSAAYASSEFFGGSLLIGIVALFLFVKSILPFANWRNRRPFVGRVKRILNWEFWPIQIFSLPVVLYVFLLGIRHRSLTVFTCANPGMLAGGFIGESKNSIYDALSRSSNSDQFLLSHLPINESDSLESNLRTARDFIGNRNPSYPVILKPDIGERGKGVKIIRDENHLEEQLESIKTDHVLQEYFPGVEASVFYYRYPNQKKGAIFSITEKRFPKLTGDGKRDLGTLILADSRAVCLAKSYFEQNRDRLEMIPECGEEVQIINIGTHSMGSTFFDGSWLLTDSLIETIDRIAREFEGFYFGRFDLRAPSFEDFRRGENL